MELEFSQETIEHSRMEKGEERAHTFTSHLGREKKVFCGESCGWRYFRRKRNIFSSGKKIASTTGLCPELTLRNQGASRLARGTLAKGPSSRGNSGGFFGGKSVCVRRGKEGPQIWSTGSMLGLLDTLRPGSDSSGRGGGVGN